ncbi:MAG: hypothetical protein FGF48_06030 [Candidatus Brockarchaeota archaeon]|nr:hypothetical protein [Candidatus Brockarchaeota archaeon]
MASPLLLMVAPSHLRALGHEFIRSLRRSIPEEDCALKGGGSERTGYLILEG